MRVDADDGLFAYLAYRLASNRMTGSSIRLMSMLITNYDLAWMGSRA